MNVSKTSRGMELTYGALAAKLCIVRESRDAAAMEWTDQDRALQDQAAK